MEEDQEIAQSEEISNELLRQQLQNLEEELRIPYEQRIDENSIDVEVQLKKAIQELGNREQACKCMAGIALFLLNKNDQVAYENQKLNQDIDSIKNQLYEQLDMCGQEKDQLKQQIENYINKLQSEIQIENSLQRKQIKLKSTKNILKQEIEAKNQKVQELQQHFTQLKQDHDELAFQMERIKNEYYQEYSKNRKVSAEEKKIHELQRQSIMLDQKNKLYQQINEDLEAKNEIL